MPSVIKDLMADADIVALTLRQPLVSIDGPEVPVFPPTYPPDQKRKTHRLDTPYTINETKDGIRTCELDSVQSQANRMEAAFAGVLADVVPRHVVSAGNHQVDLVSLPHRITDASIRATEFAGEIKASLEAFEAGDFVPLASIAPTSLVYGAWDSRDTQVRLPRAVRSGIRASDVSASRAQRSTREASRRKPLVWMTGTGRKLQMPASRQRRPWISTAGSWCMGRWFSQPRSCWTCCAGIAELVTTLSFPPIWRAWPLAAC